MSGVRWNPWAALKARPDLELGYAHFSDDVLAMVREHDDWTAIVLNSRLGRRERRCTLAHELGHVELGIGACAYTLPSNFRTNRIQQEAQVEAWVATRLVPRDELAPLIDSLVDAGIPPERWYIAEEFDVTDDVAQRAMEMLAGGEAAGAA